MMLLPIIVILIIAGYIISVYNSFQTTKTRIKASIQEIGNQLKRQSDLIPNLIESVKGYMKHEKDIFDKITMARKMVAGALETGTAKNLVEASQSLQNALGPIRAVFESTPELQAAGPTSQLMNELTDTADKVMYSRRTLIDLTADYNIKVVTFPSSLIAGMFGFKAEAGLEVSPEAMKTPKVEL